MAIINLSGSINACSVEDMQREADRFADNGWTLRDPTTHTVSVSIAVKDLEAFCDYLRSRPQDRNPKAWSKAPDGTIIKEPSVSFYLDGSEMTGTWIRLRSRIKTDGATAPSSASTPTPTRRQAPVTRQAPIQQDARQRPPVQPQPSALPSQQPDSDPHYDDIPF